MPKTNTNKNQRRKRNASKKQKRSRKTPLFSSGTHILESASLAKSLVNPFEYSACIPDGSRGIGCFSVKQTMTLMTGTTGTTYSIFVNPSNPGAIYAKDDGGTGPHPSYGTGNWSAAASNSTITSVYRNIRPVSAGIKVTYTGTTINDGGVLFLGQFPAGSDLTSVANGVNLAALANKTMYFKTFPLRSGGMITWRPSDMDDIMNFQPNSNPWGLATTINTPYIGAVVYNAVTNSASSVQVEFVVNYEGQYSLQTFLAGGLNNNIQNPAEPGWFEKALNFVRKVEPIVPYLTPWPQLLAPRVQGDRKSVV